MNKTAIEWTNLSANPLKYRDQEGNVVWGCVHASRGCMRCYSETLAKRYGRGGPFDTRTMRGLTPFLDDAELHKMLTAKRVNGVQVSGSRCFVGDMTDVFGEWVPDEILDRLFAVFALRPDVTWQVLTKRADRMREYFERGPMGAMMAEDALLQKIAGVGTMGSDWPLPNVWLGVSAEDQKAADERIPHLLQTPAAVRFVSAEPLLGSIRFADVPGFNLCGQRGRGLLQSFWVIVGGESGPGARPMDIAWARSIVDQCKTAGVPVFVKQLGASVRWGGIQGGYGDGPSNTWPASTRVIEDTDPSGRHGRWRILLKDRKGGDPSEWPEYLRVREFPATQRAEQVS